MTSRSANHKLVDSSIPTKSAENPVFPGQHHGETVEFVFRQHPAVMRRPLIYGLVAIVLVIVPLDFPIIYSVDWLAPLLLKIVIGATLFVFAYWFYTWMKWYYSVFIITVERIVQIHQNGFFKRNVQALFHGRVHALNYTVGSFDAALFHYGDIQVLTEVGNFELKMIPHPAEVHERILEVIRNNRDRFDDADHEDKTYEK